MTKDEISGVYDARAEIEFDGSTNRTEIDAALLALEGLAPSRDSRILDVGCGPGWFLAAMATAGYRRTCGIDISARSLRKAAEICGETQTILVLGDVSSTALNGFDVLTALNACLGCFGPTGDQQFLDAMFRALKPGGRLLLTFIGPEVARRRVGDFKVRYSGSSDIDVISQVSIRGDPQWLVVHQQIGRRSVPEERIRILNRSEVDEMLEAAGFERSMYSDYAQGIAALPFVDFIIADKPA